MAYQPQPPLALDAAQVDDSRDPGLAIPTKITTSQQTVLDQLHNHVAFSESLIFLSGPKGAGKTTLLEVFLEQASDYANLAYIPNPKQTKPAALRSKLLRQLVNLNAYSTDDSLLEALQRNLKPDRQHLIICIDNGDSLANSILVELQELVSSRHLFNEAHRISVVIAGETSWVKRASKGISLAAQEAPIVVTIPAFFKREQQWFARKLAATQGDNLDAPHRRDGAITEWLAKTDGYPGQIQAILEEELLQRPQTERAMHARRQRLQEQPAEGGSIGYKRWLSARQLVIILVGLVLLIVLAIGLYARPSTDDRTPEVTEPTTTDESRFRNQANQNDTVRSSLANDASGHAKLDNDLPPSLASQQSDAAAAPATDATVPQAEAPVVMSFDDALHKLQERTDDQPQPRDVQFRLVQPVQYLNRHAEAAANRASQPAADDPTANVATDEIQNPYLAAYDNLELWQRTASHFVFQVAAFNSQAQLNQFLASYSHPEMAIYQTQRNQRDWFMVVVGDFESAGAAQAYLAGTPDLQSMQPWLKAVRLVHEDLAPVMGDSAQDSNN